ncbi:MAG: hypothetical protein EA367_16470 [Leptolyngbya sp. DLM2.Bin15]|nr:MAG: hypothetical protein EA367_16470 [Leptolyngbya sp. DLM2.Bin15]
MTRNADPFNEHDLQRLQLFIYFIPVLGFFPALWALYRQQGDRRQQIASRLSVVLALGWVLSYALLGAGAQSSANLSFSLLLANSVITSGYFLTSFLLMLRVWQRKPLWLPGVSDIGDRLP